MRIAVVGFGRMGQAVAAQAERRGHDVTARLRSADAAGAGFGIESLGNPQVAIEFTRPDAAPANVTRLVELGVPVVTGTTGWAVELPRVAALVEAKGGALLHGPNFSIGLALLLEAARALALATAGRPEFDAAILEQHHRKKLDAPSGTAIAIQTALTAADPTREWPITSQRLGWIPGTHQVSLDGEYETLTLTHTVRDRTVFAAGALAAAEWLPGRRGVFTFAQAIGGAKP